MTEVEIDEDDAASSPRKRHRDVRNRRRLSLAALSAREHDRASASFEVGEVEVGRKNPVRLGRGAAERREQDEASLAAEPARRVRKACEKRHLELLLHLTCRTHARVQRVSEKDQKDAEQEA